MTRFQVTCAVVGLAALLLALWPRPVLHAIGGATASTSRTVVFMWRAFAVVVLAQAAYWGLRG